MKKYLALLLSLLIAAGATIWTFKLAGGGEEAMAANVKSLDVVDDFNGNGLNTDNWTATEGVKQNVEYSALRLDKINTWGSYVTLQKLPLESSWESFKIEMNVNWIGSSGWSGIFFGNPSASALFSGSKYFLHINSGGIADSGETGRGIRLSPKDPSSSGFYSDAEHTQYSESSLFTEADLLSGGSVKRVIMEFTANNDEDGTHELSLSWGDPLSDESGYTVHDYSKIRVNGYMGFSTYGNMNMEIRYFKLSVGADVPFTDNFESGDISFPSSPSSGTAWRGVGDNTEAKTYCGKFCTVAYDGVKSGSLFYANPLEMNANGVKSFEMTYDIAISNLTADTYLGSGFGIENMQSSGDSNNFIGVAKKNSDYVLALIKNGQVEGKEIAVSQLTGLTATFKFEGYYDKSVKVYVNDIERATFKNVDFNGYTAVSAVTPNANAVLPAKSATIDNFQLYTYVSMFADGSDTGINFKGSKEYEIAGEMINEHYVNTRKWVMYGGVKLPIQMNRNYVQFHDISGEAAFGSKTRYGDSIVRFDFRPSSMPDGVALAGFGYSFGRELLDTSYNDAPGVYFKKDGNTTSIVGKNMKTAMGGTSAASTVNVFEGGDDWYTCMIILSSRTVKVFVKKTADADSSFGKPQITFTDVDTFGYSALMIENTGKAYYNATNFSIVNIDPMRKERV